VSLVNDLWTYRGLVGNLAQRELKARYKRSILGWAWSLVNPAATLATYALVFGTLFKQEPELAGNGHLRNFAMFLFAGLLMWNFFSAVVNGSMASLVAAGPLLKKVYFPAECAPAANMLVAMSQAAIESGILLAILAIAGNTSWTMLLVPVLIALIGIFAFGIGLMLSVANVYFRDVAYLVAVLMNLLFYATPIVYQFSYVQNNAPHWAQTLVRCNPIHRFVEAMRDVTYRLVWPSLSSLAILAACAVVSFTLGWAIFRRFGERVSEAL
jgi:ABC-type polysaccharide/polyol phosphate export permease